MKLPFCVDWGLGKPFKVNGNDWIKQNIFPAIEKPRYIIDKNDISTFKMIEFLDIGMVSHLCCSNKKRPSMLITHLNSFWCNNLGFISFDHSLFKF